MLGTNAARSADLNFLAQLAMAASLTLGMFLARKRYFRAHGWTQSAVLLLNLVAIGSVMLPSFRRQVLPHLVSGWHDAYYAGAMIHAGLGGVVELLGLYVVLVAGTNLVPTRLRFRNYKLWMRTTLALWWGIVVLGSGLYALWYVQPSPGATPAASQTTRPAVAISLKNFSFVPNRLTVPAGTQVEWVDAQGRHKIVADDGSFKSPELTSGARFQQRFTKPGVYKYYCEFHGGPGGQEMAGTVTVK